MSKVGFIPLDDRILVLRTENKEEVIGGIIVPDSSKEKPMRGLVVAVGSGRNVVLESGSVKKTPLTVKVGDDILFGKWSGTEAKINGKEHLIMKESDVLGIMET
ncbi:MAG: co-chaperone GroES [Alphaproteobacteria bacterium]|nr:co-chaperone GroES [Rickettsiales bacterium]